MRTVSQTVALLQPGRSTQLPAPEYDRSDIYPPHNPGNRVGLAVESMQDHMTSEGWELFAGLQYAGYALHGRDIGPSMTDVRDILHKEQPGVVVLQDKREYEGLTADRSRDPKMRFTNVEVLAQRHDIFKLTVLKDCQHNLDYHRRSAEEIGCHAWVTYYHPDIVCHLAPYVRREHLVRTYHSVDQQAVPDFSSRNRRGCLLSGAMSSVYPLRRRLLDGLCKLPETEYLHHPGYHRSGCATPGFLRLLSRFKVAICTSSIYGYALRKIIEATACGCVVISDLPTDEVLPEIDDNVIRVGNDKRVWPMAQLMRELLDKWDPKRQEHLARLAQDRYDYRTTGMLLARDIETLRRSYSEGLS